MTQEGSLVSLAIYGSMAPGEPNHWVVSRIEGEWVRAHVRGYMFEITWGAAEGYQGFLPDADGADVAVWILQSSQLDQKWREIDDFEGSGYERRSIVARLAGDVEVEAQIYVALTDV